MYLHITTGTVSYLHDIFEKHHGLSMNAIGQDAVLYYEDDTTDTLFNSKRTYNVLCGGGNLNDQYPTVISTIPVAHSSHDSTIGHLKDFHYSLEKQSGLISHRIGELVDGDSFVVITTWASKTAYKDFKDTDSYQKYLKTDVLHKYRNAESLFQDYISSKLYLPLKDNVHIDEEEQAEF